MVSTNGYVDAIAKTEWDSGEEEWSGRENGMTCEINYVDMNVPRALTLSEMLDRQFGIDNGVAEKIYYLSDGLFFSMKLDSQKRIKRLSTSGKPIRFTQEERDFENSVPATIYIDTEFDEKGDASIFEPKKLYDPVRGTFYLSWGEASTWYAIAPNLAIGAASDGTLAEIRLTGIHAQPAQPATKQQAEGLWRRLQRRFGLR